MDLVLRRQSIVPTLITFPDVNNYSYNSSVTNCKITISNGNHFYYNGYRRGTAGACFINRTTVQNAVPSDWPPLFSVKAGDEMVMKLKNVTVYSNTSASNNGYATVSLRNASNTNIIGFVDTTSDSPLYAVGKATAKTYDELSVSATITADDNVYMLRFHQYGTAQAPQIRLTCDLEVYKNGRRLI